MNEMKNIELTKQEFFGLMMIYAANIDGEEHADELQMIKNSIGEESFNRAYRLFETMNDYELINYFRDHKSEFFKSDVDEKIFLSEIRSVISADHHVDIMERTLMLAFQKILKE
jgi:hypothetical protein